MKNIWHSILRGALALFAISSCADSARENIVDPVVAPTIEMSDPVLDGGTILIEWRYLSEGNQLDAFRVTRLAEGSTAELGRVSAILSGSDWKTGSLRDSVLIAGVQLTYRVTGILQSGRESSSASETFRVEGPGFGVLPYDQTTEAIRLRWSGLPADAERTYH